MSRVDQNTRKKPTYQYPDFVSKVELRTGHKKRYWLSLEIDKGKSDGIVVILKNPSRANKLISDKTVFNVSNYIFKNRDKYAAFKQVGKVIIVNLMPNYLTDSSGLIAFKKTIINKENRKVLNTFCSQYKNVIIAWGDHPKGLFEEYEKLKASAKRILRKHQNQVFYVQKMSAAGNPKHGQVWGYQNELIKTTV
jgi:hypothetical protein